MIDWVRNNEPKRIVMVTECSMADNVQAELPDVEFVRPCNLCPHMKRITLPKILDSLVYMKEEVVIDAGDRRQGAPLGRAHGQSEELTGERTCSIASSTFRAMPGSGRIRPCSAPTRFSRSSRSTTR